MLITELEPKKVFYYFSEISKIPHGSGNTEKIALYCIDFAKKRGLKTYRDTYGNVMIFKDGTKGYEQSRPVIIQGHLDMVCEKLPDCTRDMEAEGVELVIDGEYISADGTTLGGDDGIAVAYILAILDSNDISHPPIEALLTVDEEIGLRGAGALDVSQLKGRRLINIDSEEEGILTVSCAGGLRAECKIPLSFSETAHETLCSKKISAAGFLGGHSGIDIDKRRKNAAKVLAELLYELNKQIGVNIADISSGGRLNVIPQSAEAVVCFKDSLIDDFNNIISGFNNVLKRDCETVEPDVCVTADDIDTPVLCADGESTRRIIFVLMQIFDGVYAMNPSIDGLVQTSSNLGSVSIDDDRLEIGLMVRSNTAYGKRALIRRLESLTEYIGAELCLGDDYPAWEYRQHSCLRDTMIDAYKAMYHESPQICAIHAGLECGILAEKLGDVDMVSFGPDMENVHTPAERLSIKSAERCWKYLLLVLEMLK